jgi:O-methyltransferase domain/Dimerisation domain
MTERKDREANPTPTQPSPQEAILHLALGYLASRGLHVATELGIADLLKDGPKSIAELARATGAQQQSLYRLLRMLAGQGVFAEEPPGHFRLTPMAAVLQVGVAGSVHDAVQMVGDLAGDGSWWTAVARLRHSVMTGEPGFTSVHGMGFFDYLTQHPEAGVWFDRGLANFATTENPAIVSCYDFGQCRRVIDVGGGQGGFLAEVLKAFPSVTGVLYDRPEVIQEPAYLTAAGLLNRCEVVGGDFFQSVPGGGAVYVLKRILHDWGDERSVQILRRCRGAMGGHARLLVVDAVVPPGNDPHPSKIMDMLMMVLVEGQERTEQEFGELFQQAGLKLTKVIPTPSVLSIVEGVIVR